MEEKLLRKPEKSSIKRALRLPLQTLSDCLTEDSLIANNEKTDKTTIAIFSGHQSVFSPPFFLSKNRCLLGGAGCTAD